MLILTLLLASCEPVFSAPDYEALSRAIHRVENGSFEIGTGKGEQYGIHSVHYDSAKEAKQISIRTARRAWERYLALNKGKVTKAGYLKVLGRKYCPVNPRWAYMVGYYYKGEV